MDIYQNIAFFGWRPWGKNDILYFPRKVNFDSDMDLR